MSVLTTAEEKQERKRSALADLEYFVKKFIVRASVDASFYNIFDEDKFEIWAKPSMKTAATNYDEKNDKHVIFIGSNLRSEYANTEYDKDLQKLVTALLIHESGHILYTENDLKKVNEILKKEGIPFADLNLAEDARIEHKIKQFIFDEVGAKYKFDFDKWLPNAIEKPDMSPESILFNIINTERRRPIPAIMYSKVEKYYDRFIAAKDTFEVIDILVEWKKDFHKNQQNQQNQQNQCQNPSQGQGQGQGQESSMEEAIRELMEQLSQQGGDENGDPSQEEGAEEGNGINMMDEEGQDEEEKNMAGQGDDEEEKGKAQSSDLKTKHLDDMASPTGKDGKPMTLDEMKEGATQVTNNPNSFRESSVAFRIDDSYGTIQMDELSNTDEIFNSAEHEPGEYLHESITKIVSYLKEIESESKQKNISTRKPSRRLNSRNLYGIATDPGNTKLFKRKTKKPTKLNDKDITFILDMSGSMGGHPMEAQRTMLIAANRLCKTMPNLNINVIGIKAEHKLLFQVVNLPINESDLLSIYASGWSGGMEESVGEHSTLLKRQDFLVFVTDGGIQGEIKKDTLREKIGSRPQTVGMYVGPSGIANEQMKEWFDQTVTGEDLLEATKELVSIFNKKGKTLSHRVDNSVSESSAPKI